jgi:hypothetical protein
MANSGTIPQIYEYGVLGSEEDKSEKESSISNYLSCMKKTSLKAKASDVGTFPENNSYSFFCTNESKSGNCIYLNGKIFFAEFNQASEKGVYDVVVGEKNDKYLIEFIDTGFKFTHNSKSNEDWIKSVASKGTMTAKEIPFSKEIKSAMLKIAEKNMKDVVANYKAQLEDSKDKKYDYIGLGEMQAIKVCRKLGKQNQDSDLARLSDKLLEQMKFYVNTDRKEDNSKEKTPKTGGSSTTTGTY